MKKENNEDFWRELMGQPPEEPSQEPLPGDKNAPPIQPGFTIEYLSKDGETIKKEPPKPAAPAPKPAQPVQRPAPPVQRSAAPTPKPAPKEAATEEHTRRVVIPPERAAAKDVPPAPKPAAPAPNETPIVKRPAPQPQKTTEERERELWGNKDFNVDFDYEGEYKDADPKVVRRGRGRRLGCFGGILYFLFIICVSAVLACLGWMAATDVLGLGKGDMPINVTVPREWFSVELREEEQEDGTTVKKSVTVADIDQVADMLYENDLIRYKWAFKLFANFASADEKITAGTYVLNTNYDYRAIIYGMNPRSGERVQLDITIPEGYSIYQIVKLLDDKGVCESEDMWEALKNAEFEDYDFVGPKGDKLRLEGYLFPDTYTVYMSDTPSRVIEKFLKNFNNKWTEEMQARADELGYTREQILIIASMIEKEAGKDDERDEIASVIYNRLENPSAGTQGYLQIDATIYYAISESGEEFSKDLDDPYNTYKYKGLPPGPIGNPGMASIKAALNPADTNYYYYALGKDGGHKFFKTYDEHLAFINSDQYGG